MRRSRILAWLLLLSASALAQGRTVRVRLWWLHPPAEIHLEPIRATVKACSTCPAKPMTTAAKFSADDSQTTTVHGLARLYGQGLPSVSISGDLTIQPREGVLLLTLEMPMEDYVAAVLAGESAGFQSDEALKAMAVAARTYAVHFRARHKLEGFDLCDTTHCQDLRLASESARLRAAVAATEGELLWFQGRPAATYYHRSCGGELEDAAALDPQLHAPYLRQQQDQYCTRGDEWHAEITKHDLADVLRQPVNTVRVGLRSESGRARTILVNEKPLTATDFRLRVGRVLGWDRIRSDLYQLEDRGDRIVVRGRGQGHGVGLCQRGADNKGQQGHSYREILAYYYPGATVGINAQGLVWRKYPGAGLDVVATTSNDATTLLPAAESALQFALERTGWPLNSRPEIRVFPTIAIYRDATGEPGWVAASTRANRIRLQPIETLRRTNSLKRTLRHEFLHLVIESQASPKTPLWLREGLTVYLEDPVSVNPAKGDPRMIDTRLESAHTEAATRAAYRASASAVSALVLHNGLPAVLGWVKNGLPPHP